MAAVWVVLYGFMAVAAWLVWYEREHLIEEKRLAMAAFGVQLVLNALWPWLFFALRSPVLALGELIVLHFAVQYTGFLFSRIRAAAGWLWLGYVGWTVFAILLNYAVVAMAR
ncbi:MAG: translocator protein [Fimbriimonadaceae bacterium]|nr:translocator protein [Fimbriimonadaceae bacterium]